MCIFVFLRKWGEKRAISISFEPAPVLVIYLFNKQLGSAYCGLGTELGANDAEVNNSGGGPGPPAAHTLFEKTDNKLVNKGLI